MTKGRSITAVLNSRLLLIITGVFVCTADGGCSGPPARSTPRTRPCSLTEGLPVLLARFYYDYKCSSQSFPDYCRARDGAERAAHLPQVGAIAVDCCSARAEPGR